MNQKSDKCAHCRLFVVLFSSFPRINWDFQNDFSAPAVKTNNGLLILTYLTPLCKCARAFSFYTLHLWMGAFSCTLTKSRVVEFGAKYKSFRALISIYSAKKLRAAAAKHKYECIMTQFIIAVEITKGPNSIAKRNISNGTIKNARQPKSYVRGFDSW